MCGRVGGGDERKEAGYQRALRAGGIWPRDTCLPSVKTPHRDFANTSCDAPQPDRREIHFHPNRAARLEEEWVLCCDITNLVKNNWSEVCVCSIRVFEEGIWNHRSQVSSPPFQAPIPPLHVREGESWGTYALQVTRGKERKKCEVEFRSPKQSDGKRNRIREFEIGRILGIRDRLRVVARDVTCDS
jgi:hypothetical protein